MSEPVEIHHRKPPNLTVRDALLIFGQHEKNCASHLSTNELRQYCDCYFGTCLAWYAMPHPNGPSSPAWEPIETAPRDGTLVLIYDQGIPGWPAQYVISRWEPEHIVNGFGGTYTASARWEGVKAATHWMPLPDPPKAQP